MNFAEILSDEKTFTDDMEIVLPPRGDGQASQKVRLGDIRDLSRKQQQALAARLDETNKEFDKARSLATQAAEALAKIQGQATDTTTTTTKPVTTTDTEDYYETDPLYAPVRKRYSALEAQLKEAADKLKGQETIQTNLLTLLTRRMVRDDFDRVRDKLKGDKYKEWRDPDKLANYAVQHRLVDDMGMPSLERAVSELTREDEVTAAYQRGIDEGRKKGTIDARLASMQRPTSASGKTAAQQPAGLDPTQNFEDLGDKIMDDPEALEMLSQLGALSPADIQ